MGKLFPRNFPEFLGSLELRLENESGMIREYRCFAYDGKEFSWQSNERGTVIAWLGFVDPRSSR